MERLVELVQRRARERAQRFVGRTMEVLVEGPSRTDPLAAARPHPPQQDGQLRRARPSPGELVEVEITRRHLDDADAGAERLLSRAA